MSHLGDELSGGVCGREEEEEEILYPKPPMLLKLVSENNHHVGQYGGWICVLFE